MTRDEFNNITRVLSLAGEVLADLDIAGYLRVLDEDSSFGWLFGGPLVWSDRRDACDRLRDLARAALAFRNARSQAMAQAEREATKAAGHQRRGEGV